MNGLSNTTFAPGNNITRAMFVTVLYRIEKEPSSAENTFEDIESGSYYEKAVGWANANGIINGVSDTAFAPNANITREQIAAIMFRYAKYKGTAPTGAWAIRLDYADTEDISDWAAEAVMFCKLKGIMQGKDGNLFAPKANATRAETAAILERYLQN